MRNIANVIKDIFYHWLFDLFKVYNGLSQTTLADWKRNDISLHCCAHQQQHLVEYTVTMILNNFAHVEEIVSHRSCETNFNQLSALTTCRVFLFSKVHLIGYLSLNSKNTFKKCYLLAY